MKRRDAITKAAVVAGTLLAFKSVAAPASKNISFAGGWLIQGLPCAIFQEGSVLLVVNEVGSLFTAQVTAPNTFILLGAGVTAVMVNGGQTINWSNGSVWTRP